jgi:hypothetical protein
MADDWKYQLRVYLTNDFAELARHAPDDPALLPLARVLDAHGATLKCQFDAFADYVAEAEASGVEQFPLYKWTKATLDDPAKCQKHRLAFAVRLGGEELYPKAPADALAADLVPLAGGAIVTRMSLHDSNPANNLPVPAAFRGS